MGNEKKVLVVLVSCVLLAGCSGISPDLGVNRKHIERIQSNFLLSQSK